MKKFAKILAFTLALLSLTVLLASCGASAKPSGKYHAPKGETYVSEVKFKGDKANIVINGHAFSDCEVSSVENKTTSTQYYVKVTDHGTTMEIGPFLFNEADDTLTFSMKTYTK